MAHLKLTYTTSSRPSRTSQAMSTPRTSWSSACQACSSMPKSAQNSMIHGQLSSTNRHPSRVCRLARMSPSRAPHHGRSRRRHGRKHSSPRYKLRASPAPLRMYNIASATRHGVAAVQRPHLAPQLTHFHHWVDPRGVQWHRRRCKCRVRPRAVMHLCRVPNFPACLPPRRMQSVRHRNASCWAIAPQTHCSQRLRPAAGAVAVAALLQTTIFLRWEVCRPRCPSLRRRRVAGASSGVGKRCCFHRWAPCTTCNSDIALTWATSAHLAQ